MKKQDSNPGKGIMMTGSFRSAGITFYMRQGQIVGRVARSKEKRSNTLPQFNQRQRVRHTVALWQALSQCEVMFTRHKSAYQGFVSFANKLPVVYVPRTGDLSEASLLMPGIPVSDGTLPEINEWIGEVDGTPALLTDLVATTVPRNNKLLLYTAEQSLVGDSPRVHFTMRQVPRSEMTVVDGKLAIVGAEFADEMKGWALVRVDADQCSPQTVVTGCTYYQQFTTEEALAEAAKSYGGLTK